MSIKELIQSYYDSLNNKNNSWQEIWAEDAVFQDASGVLSARGKLAIKLRMSLDPGTSPG